VEEEDRMSEYRRDLFIVLRSISKIAPDVTRAFVQSNLLAVLGDKDASAEEVEVRPTWEMTICAKCALDRTDFAGGGRNVSDDCAVKLLTNCTGGTPDLAGKGADAKHAFRKKQLSNFLPSKH
jgi:hypothetical protein